MGNAAMGRVTVLATVENLDDVRAAEQGKMASEAVRRVEVLKALVGTGATTLSMPQDLIVRLGLQQRKVRPSMTAGGRRDVAVYSPVNLIIQGRDCVVEVAELPDGCPVLVGQIPLEAMDWVVDPNSQRLIKNPDHDGEWAIEQF
jgi:predicted aspartyl protease